MRLWSLHPRHLDRAGLVAAWREALLAQAVIEHPGRGYANHPQLVRFRSAADPLAAIGDFLAPLADEADARGYRFARAKIRSGGAGERLVVSAGQLDYEWSHLLAKLSRRSPGDAARAEADGAPTAHPLFLVEPGPVAEWERVPDAGGRRAGDAHR